MTKLTNHGARTTARSKGEDMVTDLRNLALALQAGKRLDSQFTVRTYKIAPPPPYRGAAVRRVRELLAMSQAAFAALLGVDPSTVRSWEQELRRPSPIACRLLSEIEADPDHWRTRLVTCLATRNRS